MVINPIIGFYIPIMRIPIKGGMTIPNIATFDHGTHGNGNSKIVALGRCFSFFLLGRFNQPLIFSGGGPKMGPYYIVVNGVITPINSLING